MSKQASKTLIGAFVLGASALVVAAVIIFGSGKFFKKTFRYVLFFEGSVKGLSVGAPVIFHGVNVGRVTDIRLLFNGKDLTILIPVYIEVDPDKARVVNGDLEKEAYFEVFIDKGLKAQLQMQSFVTGQFLINLDLYPDKPIRLVGIEKRYPEIPTISSTMEELTKTLQELPIKELIEKINHAVDSIDQIAGSPELKESIRSLNQTLKSFDRLANNVDSRVGPLSSQVSGAADAALSAFVQAEKTLKMEEGTPGEIAANIKETLAAARVTLEETQKAVEGFKQIGAQNANLGYEISKTLSEISALTRSLRSLADYLDRHPESLLKGKPATKGE
jgi:paraquat-inducible protein B